MKKSEKAQIAGFTLPELVKRIEELETKLASGQVNRYTKQSKNTREAKHMRVTLAVYRTIARQKEIAHG